MKNNYKTNEQLLNKIDKLNNTIADLKKSESKHKQAEQELRIERGNLKNIFEAMEDGVYIVNQQYDIQYVNAVLTKDFGIYAGSKCYEYFHDRKEVCTWCKNPDVFAGKTVRWEWTSSKNGKTYDLIDTPLKNSDGSISKLEIFRDITVRKQVEEKLSKQKAKILSIFRTAPIGIGVVQNRILLEVNDRMCEMTGYSKDELFNKNSRMIYPTKKEFDYVGKEKYKQIKATGTGIVQTRFKRKDGKIIDIILSSTPIDPNNFSNGITFTALDITDRKKAEESLQKSEKQYRLLADYTYDWVYWINPEGEYIYLSSACEKISGYKIEEFISNPNVLYDLVRPDYFDKVYKHYHDENNKDTPVYRMDFPIIARNGNEIWLEHNCSPMFDADGNYLGRRGNNRDITKRKLTEKKLISRNRELETWAEVTTDRELKMLDLKKEINELLEKSGKMPKYKIIV